MSTNIKQPSVEELDLTGVSQAVSAGLPDPSVLADIANQLFKQFPGQSVQNFSAGSIPPVPEAAVSHLSLPSLSPSALSSQVPSPDTAGITSINNFSETDINNRISESDLATLAGEAQQAARKTPQPASPSINIPGIPGGVSAADFSAVPSFSFLQDARSLVSTGGLPAGNNNLPAVKIPTETTIKGFAPELPGYIPGSAPAVPAGAISTPQVPGAISRTGDKGPPAAFSFLDTIRPVSSVNVVPELAPVVNESGSPKQSGLLSASLFDVNAIRRDFPILQEIINGRPLVWLDNAATTQKPQSVIDRISYFYEHENSNVHRAAHTLAARSTDAYDAAREKVRRFLKAGSVKEIVFVRGATEAINLVAKSWGQQNIQQGDEIVISHLEHHANIVPWQMLCAAKGAKLRVIPVDNTGQVLLDEYEKLLRPKTRLVALAQVSNALGTVTPVQEMTATAHRYGAKVLIDGAQAVSHMSVDVQAYDCDFYVFSGHKVFGPTGIGVVYGKEEILNATQPWQGGGNMIVDVTFEKTVYHPAPFRFEAGTGNIADAVGLGAALDYVERIGMANIHRYEHELLIYATEGLKPIPGLHLIGTAKEKASVLSFVLDGYTTEQVGQALNKEGIAVRSGHHCAQPILRRFGVEATVRPSLAFYNTCEEVDKLIATIWNLKNGRAPGLV